MGKRLDRRPDRRNECQRTLLAQKAARFIRDHGIKDFRTAKSKAAMALGMSNYGALPSNREIETALAEYNRIFDVHTHTGLLEHLRQVAIEVMRELRPFRPCLVGSVLSGNVTEYSNINLHVYSDSPESVGMRLDACGFQYRLRQRNHRIQRDMPEAFSGYDFWVEGSAIELTVFPERRKGHAPLSPIDGRPMQRARINAVETLLRDRLAGPDDCGWVQENSLRAD